MISFDFDTFRKELGSLWFIPISRFLIENWISILITVICLYLIRAIFNNIVFPFYYEKLKIWYRFEENLILFKKILEADYQDLWHDSEFCIAYLALQDEHQRLIQILRTDVNGENPKRFHWANKYATIDLK